MSADGYGDLPYKLRKMELMSFQEELTLLDVINKEDILISIDEVIKAFCSSLYEVLNESDIRSIIQKLFKIEGQLHKIHYMSEFQDREDYLPNFSNFYRNLSPILLRSLWEGMGMDSPSEQVSRSWKEALRVSIEEEIFYWKNK